MQLNWRSFGLKTGLALSLLFGSQSMGPWSMHEKAEASDGVYVPTNEWYVNPSNKDGSIIEQGRIMVPDREAARWFQMGLYANAKEKMVTLLSYDHRIVLHTGSKTAIVDGRAVQLDASPKIVNGQTYVPFRFFAEALKYSVGKRDSGYYIRFSNLYVRGQYGSETYWMNKTNGELYYSNGISGPERIGKLNMSIIDMGAWGFEVKRVGSHTIMISMLDVYGEPHLHDVIYKALLQQNSLIIEAKTDYYGTLPHNNVETYQGYLVMIDGHVAKLVDPETGKVARSYDMAALTGGKPEDKYVLEYISDDILLIRPYSNALLTAVNLKTKQTTVLYKKLLSGEWQKMLETWPQGGDYPGDQLRFVKRTKNVFEFEWTDRFNGGKKTLYNYTME